MVGVTQHQLQGVFAGWKFDTSLGLARSIVKMRLVLWNRLVGVERFIHVNQQMVMAAVLEIIAGVSYTHVAQTETTPESAFDRRAVLPPHEKEKGLLWRRLSSTIRCKRTSKQDF